MRRLLVVTATVTLVLAGCGGASDDAGSATTVAGGTTTADHTVASEKAPCEPAGVALKLVASNTKFDTGCLAAPAGQAFTVAFDNKDQLPHNLAILKSHEATDVLYRSEIFQGPANKTLDVPALEAGTYVFHCEVHPAVMLGTFVVA